MRNLLLICAALLLSGCNMVVTGTPVFDKADAAGAAPLKPGVWSAPTDPSCKFDETAPVDTWPECANGGVVADENTLMGFQTQAGKRVLTSTDYVLAAGSPRVLQARFGDPTGAMGLPISMYLYLGLKPDSTDDQGEIIAYDAWFVLCGPPPPPGAVLDGKQVYGSLKPLPGLVMDQAHDNCSPASKDALRAAAGASEQWQGSDQQHPLAAHWVRAGQR